MRFLIAGLLLFASASQVCAATYNVGKGAQFRSLSDVPWAKLVPGDEIIVGGGVNDSAVEITSHGTAERPIIVRAAPGTHPVNTRPIIFEGATYVIVDGFTVHDTMFPGFMIRHGAEGITIRNSTAYDTGEGVWIADGAAMNHRILNNVFRNNKTFGVGADRVSNVPGKETIIAGNTITGNKVHGIEIIGNYYIIEHNIVSANGWDAKGSSGIHLFARDAKANTGNHNVIRYNVSYNNKDDGGEDGNGIQLDQWCDDNQVYFNVAFGNEGAGISVYDSSGNTIYNNTLVGNMTHAKNHSYRTEFLLSGDKKVGHTSGNTIRNNIIEATRNDDVAIFVGAPAAAHPQDIGNNILYNRAAGNVFDFAGKLGRGASEWNALKKGMPDIFADPAFHNTNRAVDGGLVPRAGSPAAGKGVAVDNASVDAAGSKIDRLPIGAYMPMP